MRKIIIDGVDYTNRVALGFSNHEKLDYSLDVSSIYLPFTKREKVFPMYSDVLVYENEEIAFNGVIQNDLVQIKCKNPLLYEHEISLIEKTKLLDLIIVSGKTFRQPLSTNFPQLTLFDLIDDLRVTQPLSTVDEERAVFVINQDTEDFLKGIIAKEHTFNNTTLRECLNEIVSSIDAVVRLDVENNLVLDFFNQTKELVNGNFSNKTLHQDIEYYGVSYESSVLNPVKSEQILSEYVYYPSPYAYATPRSGEFIFSFNNIFFQTPRPIYDIRFCNVSVNLVIGIGGEDDVILNNYDVDISGRILEKELHRTQDVYKVQIFSGSTQQLTNKNNFFQENTVRYTYGQPNIDVSNTFGVFNDRVSLYWSILASAIDQVSGQTIGGVEIPSSWEYSGQVISGKPYTINIETSYFNNNFENGLIPFNLAYLPVPRDIRVKIDREDIENVSLSSSLIVNQQSRIVDIRSFKDNIYGRVNMLGNDEIQLTHRIKKLSNSFNLGDYTNDRFIISEKETIFFNDYYYCKYVLTKNFNKISQFIGLNTEIRQWEIGEGGRTLERDLIYKEFIYVNAVSEEPFSLVNNARTINAPFIERVVDTFKGDLGVFKNPIWFASIRTTHSEGQTDELYLPIDKDYGGNSLTISFAMPNNVYISDKIESETIGGITQRASKFVLYTDSRGRINTTQIKTHYTENSYDNITQKINDGLDLPEMSNRFDLQDPVTTHTLNVKKDSAEIIKGSLIYQFMPQSIDIIIGDLLTKNNRVFFDKLNNYKLRIYNDNLSLAQRRKVPKGVIEYDLDVTLNYEKAFIKLNHPIISESPCYAICDEFGNTLLIVNNAREKDHISLEFQNNRKGISNPLDQKDFTIIGSELETSVELEYVKALNSVVDVENELQTSVEMEYKKALNKVSSLGSELELSTDLEYIKKVNQRIELDIENELSIDLEYLKKENAVNSLTTENEMSYDLDYIVIKDISSELVQENQLKVELEYQANALELLFDYKGTTTQPHDFSVNYIVQGESSISCPTAQQVQNWFNANYNSENYDIGDVIRVQTFVVDGEFPVATCNTHYFEVVLV